jgi:nitrogen fixation/metabolism regulation signal transduction histidine kinase
MSHSNVLDHNAVPQPKSAPQKRRVVNAIWQPFLQFKLLMYMLGSTAIVAVLLGAFLYFAFSDLIEVIASQSDSTSYYGEMIEIQLVHLFRYCGALFVLYILLLATVCVAYTHRMIGPIRPFTRHVDSLLSGDYSSRVNLRKGDLDMYVEYGDKLNQLAVSLDMKEKNS